MTEPAPVPAAPRVVLASASAVRRRLLEGAGVAVTVAPAHIDEDEIKRAMRAEGAGAADAAVALAELKARRVSRDHAGALVIGADQILDLDGEWFDKPPDMDHAKAHLRTLGGRTHGLATAACVVRDGQRIWHHVATPRLTMRPLSEGFVEGYLARAGADVLGSVGAYRLEGLGAQLFSRIEGDFFAILGLPLLPLLDFLREHGAIPR